MLKAIALEELALAHIINAEAEKAQAVTKMPITPFTPDELIAFQQSVAKVLEMVVAKETILLKKLRLLLAQCPQPCPTCRKVKHPHHLHPHKHRHCDHSDDHSDDCHDHSHRHLGRL
ncbi:MAG TPA: hypothetical protein VK191_14375 [Symbiobacteriaceae bacterium]|nr:hypothetical protein [Symbiobacteriaceae bacterium]